MCSHYAQQVQGKGRRLGRRLFRMGFCRHVRRLYRRSLQRCPSEPSRQCRPPYVCAQLAGGFLGAVLVWAFYKYHFDATQDNPDGMLGCFCTMPAIDKRGNNLLSEVIATFVLVFIILALGTDGNMGHAGDTPVGMGSLGAFPVTCLIIALGMSLGGTTGYAMNPARDLPPRIAHALLPIKGKRDSGWSYSWVPVVGPVLGAIIAAALYLLVY